jgi:hypothetical protein
MIRVQIANVYADWIDRDLRRTAGGLLMLEEPSGFSARRAPETLAGAAKSRRAHRSGRPTT